MGDFLHLTCCSCAQSWWAEPERRMSRLALLLRRPTPAVDRCPRCFGSDVRLSVDLHLAAVANDRVVIDLTGARPVVWLDGVQGKERSDLPRP